MRLLTLQEYEGTMPSVAKRRNIASTRWAVAAWLGLVLVIAFAASAAPALRAARLVVREALAYE